MTITAWDIYWITRLDGIREVASFIACPSLVFTIIGAIAMTFARGADAPKEVVKAISRMMTAFAVSAVVFLTACVFLPSTKEMCAIKVIPLIANNQDVQGLGADVVSLAREWVQELRPKVEKPKAEEPVG